MVYIDAYDDEAKFLGKKEYNEVHKKGLWHNVIYSFIYDKNGYIYFILKDYFSIVSGHIYSLEDEDDALTRILKENTNQDNIIGNAFNVIIAPYKKDEISNGILIKDRVLASIYICEINDFKTNNPFVKVNVRELLKLFKLEKDYIFSSIFINKVEKKVRLSIDNFYINDYEMSMDNYLLILKKISEVTSFIK